MNKTDLRNEYKQKRAQLSSAEIKSYSEQIFNQITNKFEFAAKTVHVFIPISKFSEVDTNPFIKHLLKVKCVVATSITHFNPLGLSHCIITNETTYEIDKFGIPTPIAAVPINEDAIDIVIVPLLTFDRKGSRVGYGKGLYDRFLSQCNTKCIKIGVSFFDSIDIIPDVSENDIFLDYCATPNQLYKF